MFPAPGGLSSQSSVFIKPCSRRRPSRSIPAGGAAEDGGLSVMSYFETQGGERAVSFSNAFNIVCARLTVTRPRPSRRVFVFTQRRKSDWPRLRWDLRQSDLHHTETFEKRPLKLFFLCDLRGKKTFARALLCKYEDTTGGLVTGYCQPGGNDIKCITERYSLLTALSSRNEKFLNSYRQ